MAFLPVVQSARRRWTSSDATRSVVRCRRRPALGLQLVQCRQLLPTVNLLLLGNTLLEALGPALCFKYMLLLKSLEDFLGQYARRVLVPFCTQAGVVRVPNFAAAKAFGLRHELISALAGRLARAVCTCSLSLPPTVDLVGGLIVHGVTPWVH